MCSRNNQSEWTTDSDSSRKATFIAIVKKQCEIYTSYAFKRTKVVTLYILRTQKTYLIKFFGRWSYVRIYNTDYSCKLYSLKT